MDISSNGIDMHSESLFFDSSNPDWRQVIATYRKSGIVVLRNLVPQAEIGALRSTIASLLRQRLDTLGAFPPAATDIDTRFQTLAYLQEPLSWDIIRAVRDLPAFYRMIASIPLEAAITRLQGSPVHQVVHDICLFRIDPPQEGHYRRFDWHQDFPHNCMSESAITAWIPLTNVSDEMGPLRAVLGSHGEVADIQFVDKPSGATEGAGHRVFEFNRINRETLESQAIEVRGVNAGDAVLFHSCLYHASGQNRSSRCRWVVNCRYGDALDEAVVERGWKAVRDKAPYIFRDLYPHKCHDV
jgi:Phytanoyl-CoA dioxygenase (PhyH)